jgi:Na+-transporting NADH:ubiquinone oxidoreductase subunit D
MSDTTRALLDPLVDNNPITVQTLGICSALAVTTSLSTALIMCLALTVVLVLASSAISLIRNHIPCSIRLIVQITIIASLVIVIDQFLQAFLFEFSQRLSIFVGLIVTNCIVLGRAEVFALHNPVWPSAVDAMGNAAGYTLILTLVAVIRELFGTGQILGYQILITVQDGGWFQPLGFMALAPSAFFVLGGLVWLFSYIRTVQEEEPENRHSSDGSVL